jgi:hypothetical protein
MSWVMLEDVVAILHFALENGAMSGPVNVVSPQPVRNSDFTQVLAKAMHRLALFSAPAFALKLAMGEMADALVLSSQRVLPERLARLQYQFGYPDLTAAVVKLI